MVRKPQVESKYIKAVERPDPSAAASFVRCFVRIVCSCRFFCPLVTFACSLLLTWHHKTMQRRLEWCRETQRSLAARRGHRIIGNATFMFSRSVSFSLIECSWFVR